MLFPNKQSEEEMILDSLAKAYKAYEFVGWEYGKADAGIGGFFVDGCVEDAKKLAFISKTIGWGISSDKENAKIASQLFDKLYKDGFKGGLFKDKIRNNFKEILPEASIKRLDENVKMADCMLSIYIVISLSDKSSQSAPKNKK